MSKVQSVDAGEAWKEIDGFPGYYVSSFGRVIGKKGHILSPNQGRAYDTVQLYGPGKTCRRTVHRLVAEAFLTNSRNYPIINHKDENKRNNRADNLEWCDAKYNNNYGKNIWGGRKKVAEARSVGVEQIADGAVKKYSSIRDAARATGINRHCIARACRGEYHSAGGFVWRYTK